MERVLDDISFQAPDITKKSIRAEPSAEAVARAAANGEITPDLPVATRTTEGGHTEYVATVTADYVRKMVADVVKDQDLSRYIL
jgi:ATP-dependent HslUV protease ATP-binding subunit HslU